MNCGRRSAVDDVRSRRTRAVDEDRRRIRLAVDEDRHQRRWAIDDDRRRRRREIDDYPPLELPLQCCDPLPEYPPLELPHKWRNPLPDHLVHNQPAAFARDSPSLRPHLVAHDPYTASSRTHTRNPDPLIPDFKGHRRRRDADRAQRRETLRLAQVEASIDRIDALCVNVLQLVERIMSRPATIPSPSLICSTNTQALPNLLPHANNHSVADFNSVVIPIPDIQPEPAATTPLLLSAHTKLPTPPEDIHNLAITAPSVLTDHTEHPLQALVTDAVLHSVSTSSKGSADVDGENETASIVSAGSAIMAGEGENLLSARASPLSASASDASLSNREADSVLPASQLHSSTVTHQAPVDRTPAHSAADTTPPLASGDTIPPLPHTPFRQQQTENPLGYRDVAPGLELDLSRPDPSLAACFDSVGMEL